MIGGRVYFRFGERKKSWRKVWECYFRRDGCNFGDGILFLKGMRRVMVSERWEGFIARALLK